MANLDVSRTDVIDREIVDYSVDSRSTDYSSSDEVYVDFPKAAQYIGYYSSIPELKRAIDSLAIWAVGKGYEVDTRTKVILERIKGCGNETFLQVIDNMQRMKKVFGDSFAEIVKVDGKLLNLKPISAERMRMVYAKNGVLKRYEQILTGKTIKFNPEQIFHLSNDRMADEQHGTSVIDVCKWVIDARNEAMTDYRTILHRNVIPVRIIEVDTDNTTKRNALMAQYKEAIQKGEVLIIPKGTIEVKDYQIKIQDPIMWIQYLENFFYQAVGVPRVIATSQEYTEAASKVGYLTFEPIYTREQAQLEAALWEQLQLKVKFNRPASLGGPMQESEEKNTGQLGFQPKETQNVNMERE